MRLLKSTRLSKHLFVPALALMLAGCGSGGIDSLGGLFGGDEGGATVRPVTANTIAGVPVEQLRADQLCPIAQVRSGTDNLRLYASELEQTPQTVRYQATILQTAIECTPGPGIYGLTIGVAGRVLLGPQGSPASIDLPVRIVIREQATGTILASEIVRPTAIIEPTQVQTSFTFVNRALTIPTPTSQNQYEILVGFDELET